MSGDLFTSGEGAPTGPQPPLAERLRPQALGEILGQEHLLNPEGLIGRMAAARRLGSLILWGPPGVGKTTLARLLAEAADLEFVQISAIASGVAELRKVFEAAEAARRKGRGTLLFVDEIHRFNRGQQDSFLPHMESGLITLVGATTENPSFALNGALLSRSQVAVLRALGAEDLESLLRKAEAAEGRALPLTEEARARLVEMADGDGRHLLTLAEALLHGPEGEILDVAGLGAALNRRAPLYDKAQDGHFNLISALHKSVRGSDPEAALYWLCRMLVAGEDPLYIARRLVRMANEDVGLADPEAVKQALAAKEAYELQGSPEGDLALAQAAVYIAAAPKSNALYNAFKAAMASAKETGSRPPPKVILNAPTKLMKQEGYGEGYRYDHDEPDAFSGQNYFPEGMRRPEFYKPVPRGFERDMRKRLDYWEELRRRRRGD
ncbi:replication-associated recombination protein A [Neomegalonema perideroedes]|uniref:replication-associated recombination protein A n=1 Tax=Neomegalonema perideroedes TaxID=217219 RepID=UPI00036B9E47|nr:replication-associated recombination protein A [Neomegalonema perideroedes]